MALTFIESKIDNANSDSYTGTVNIGTASSDRWVILVCTSYGSGNDLYTIPGTMQIGGTLATTIGDVSINDGLNTMITNVLARNVTSGTTATYQITYGDIMLRLGIGVYTLTGIDSITPYDSTSASSSPGSFTIDIPENGFALAGGTSGTSVNTWTGLTENYDDRIEFAIGSTGASKTATSAESLAVTCTPSAGTRTNLLCYSWSPYVAPSSNDTTPAFIFI